VGRITADQPGSLNLPVLLEPCGLVCPIDFKRGVFLFDHHERDEDNATGLNDNPSAIPADAVAK
jgi:hypothetical protein